MAYTVRDYQARVNAIFNENRIRVDGVLGPATRSAVHEAQRIKQAPKRQDIFDNSGLHRVIWHWTASTYDVTHSDLTHYNMVFDYQGNAYEGAARPEHQANYNWKRKIGVSHTRNSNTGCVGLSVSAMHGASGWPKLDWGSYPLTWDGIDAMLEYTAELCEEFDIPVSPWSTLSHAEVEPTLGIPQKSKWDFMVLPGSTAPEDPVKIGNELRHRLKEKFL